VRVLAEAPDPEAGETRFLPPCDAPGLSVEAFAFRYRSGRRPAARAWRDSLRGEIAPLFARAVAARRPDVVVIGREILAPVLVELCKREGLPAVVVAHGVTLAAMQRHGADDDSREARAAVAAGLQEADRVLAVAHHLAAELRALGIERVTAVPNGADTARFRTGPKDVRQLAALGIGAGDVVAAQVSGLKPSKRPLDVVRAAQLAAADAPQLVHLVVGGGEGRAALEASAREQGVLSRFRFAGEVDHSSMPGTMNAADLVVLASEHEGLPLVFGEARASGRVVVASDIPAAREVIADGETGVLFRMGDPRDLAAKLVALARDPERRARIGACSRAEAERWTTDHAARAFSNALCAVARGREL
jgi:glycosyltransferase involved in cell wall biosynthesis